MVIKSMLTMPSNINVFALAFIIAFSVIATLCNTLILRFFIFMARFRALLAPRIEHWVQDGVYQLQRHAFEAQGQGTWQYLDEEIPTTLNTETLRKLPIDSSLPSKYSGSGQTVDRGTQMEAGTHDMAETPAESDDEKADVQQIEVV
jgi:hypothetical protein